MTDLTPLWKPGGDMLWNFRNCYHACVVPTPDDAAFPLRMWFFGWATADANPGHQGCDAIFHARGRSLDAWEVWTGDGWDSQMAPDTWAPVLTASGAHPWDEWHNGDPSVVRHDRRWYMAYSATGFNLDGKPPGDPDDTDGDLACVLGAVSDDGISWTPTEPLVICPDDFGRVAFGDADGKPVSNRGYWCRPSLMFDDGRWKLWFDYVNRPYRPEGACVGYAESDTFGPMTVLREPGVNPIDLNFLNPEVVKVGGRYLAFGDPPHDRGRHPWQRRYLTQAISADGITWRVLGTIEHDSDAAATHVPCAFVHDGSLILTYATQRGGDPYDYRYDRIRYRRQPIPDHGYESLLSGPR